MKIYTNHLWCGCFYTPLPQKNIKNVIFSCFFRFFAYGLIHIFILFAQNIYHKKNIKNILKKKHKKMGKKVFKILFYFLKMDKNKCPNLFLKKKFQKTRIFCFFSFIEHFTKNYHFIPKIRNSYFENKKVIFRG